MKRLTRFSLPTLALSGLLALGPASTALAQYRPPPLTESQRLGREAEEARLEGAKALSRRDANAARERFQKALGLYEQALAADAGNMVAAAGLGAVAMELQDFQRVVDRLAPVVRANPEQLDVVYPLAVSLYKLRRFPEALPLLEQLSQARRPEHLLVHYYLGSYALYVERGDVAVREFQAYLAQRPAELAGNDHQLHELIGRGYLAMSRAAEARQSFSRAQAGRPEAVSVQLGLAEVLALEGRGAEAKAHLAGLVGRFPKSAEARERLARMHLADGEVAQAAPLAQAMLQLGATPAAHLLMADVRMAQGAHAAAEADYRKALALAQGWVPAQVGMGQALQKQGKHEEAIRFLEQAAGAGANSVELWASLGTVNRRAGRFQRAVEVHRRVVEMAPRQALGYVLLGADHYATGQWDQAIEDYDTALQKEPNHEGARHWLAVSLAQRARARAREGRLEDASRDLRRAFDLERSAAMARRLGAVLLARQEFADARKVLGQGVELPGAGWRESFLLGYAQLGARDASAALAAFEQAARLTTQPEQQAEIYAGWALTKLELGEFDAAVEKLRELGTSKAVAQLTEANLPMALLRRALRSLEQGDAEAALKDVEVAERTAGRRNAEVVRLAAFARALAQVEQGRAGEARGLLKRALAGKPRWAHANTGKLVEAYAEYRSGQFARARRGVKALSRRAAPAQARWLQELDRGIDRREGERAYAAGNMRLAEKSLKAALADDPLNPVLQHNLACVDYRRGRVAEALAAWTRLQEGLPNASLNLGIDAQERQKKPELAVGHYARYLSAGGARASQVREWKERLQSIWAVAEPTLPTSPAAPDAVVGEDVP